MKFRVAVGALGSLVAVLLVLLVSSKRREREVISYSAASLVVILDSHDSIPRDQAEQLIGLMSAKNMTDLSTAVVLFELLHKVEGAPVRFDDELRDYINRMHKLHQGKDSPFLDTL